LLSTTGPNSGAHETTSEEGGNRYSVKLVTSDVRSAGTECDVFISLLGQSGESGYIYLDSGFSSGTHREFHVGSAKDIGPLVGVRVKRGDAGSSQKCDGWLLDRVEVVDTMTEQQLLIQAQSWFGKLDANCNGELEAGPAEKSFLAEAHTNTDSDSDDESSGPTSPVLKVYSAGSAVPHPAKVKDGARSVLRKESGYGGEDAYFAIEHEGASALGVADGVYMWRLQGIDAGEFSRALMDNAAKAVKQGAKDAREVLHAAAAEVAAAEVKGSATACIVHINTKKSKLSSANLGDSGFMVIREGDPLQGELRQVLHVSEAQEHEFGRPFQLGHHEAANSPDHLDFYCTSVQPGDVIVVGSDGLWDNLEDVIVVEQTHKVLSAPPAGANKFEMAKLLSRKLTELAFNTSMNRSVDTPYSRAASSAFDMVYSGGKKDDICVVVAIVDPIK